MRSEESPGVCTSGPSYSRAVSTQTAPGLPTRILLLTLALALGLGIATVPPGTTPPAAAEPSTGRFDTDAADQYVAEYAQRHGLSGAAFAVVKDGEAVTTGAAGDVTASTPMSVGSVAKSFTAFAVLQLVDQGTVGLDDPVAEHLPEFTVGGADPGDITVRMLLSHTSGLPNPMLVASTGSLAGDVAAIAELDAIATPGAEYHYSNLGYRTLALLVERVSGQDFDAYLHAHIFEPLGMGATTSVITAAGQDGLDDGHVTAYGSTLPHPGLANDIGGSGGVVSTAEDMSAWLAMQQRGGVTADGTRLLSADLVDSSHTIQPNAQRYGLGWQHTSTAEPARIGHDGNLLHYSAREDLVPSSGYAVVVMLDSFTPTYEHPFAISTGLIEISEGRTPEVGTPVATIIDIVLGVVTLAVLGVALRGILRSRLWVARRRSRPRWRFLVRQLMCLPTPVLAVVVFFGFTMGRGNPATPWTAFGLWPAAMMLLLAAAMAGLSLGVARGYRWHAMRHDGPGHD